MLPVHAATFRLFLHVLGATIWVGGQLTLAALVPTARELGDGAAAKLARRFDLIAWPAFALLIVTGIWNVLAIDVSNTTIEFQITLAVKLVAVAASGIGAAIHRGAKSTLVLALGGAAAGAGALVALFLGILLTT